ncbi:hypothetical protein CesoFtcFv8_027149 [Champsocephalus esox]|uniref:Galactose-3-O-sulfotransferase 4 n=1 Tax=Champsocephalus esox TaxID=159716 RepID=A0AAN8B135_9TELE|nr:hypothetical protein CesoFtcFv8_027149 [Champsocephalus esox]
MLFRRRARMLRWLVCGRVGTVWIWKALLLFVAIAFAVQLLGVIFNKSSVHPAGHSIFLSSDAQGPSLGFCQPHTHIMFLKTHKTASSTVLNMLYRFGDERNLRFALPLGYQFGYPLPFNAHRVKGYRGPRAMEFHILGHHMRFNKPEVEKVMPADTFYFSIIRDPAGMAESSFAYYKEVAPAFRKAKSLGDFADNPYRYYDSRVRNNYARNLLMFDFGMDNNANFSLAVAQKAETMIRQTFNLILLSEYFDQSMILLRHALCWPLETVVSFSLNARQQKPSDVGGLSGSFVSKAAAAAGIGFRGVRPQAKILTNVTEAQREKLRQWNAFDLYLYKTFNRTFWEDIKSFGYTQMEQEVSLLRMLRKEMAQVCLRDGGKPVEARRIRDKTIRPFQLGLLEILGYELQPGLDNATRTACLRMIRPELQYKDVLDAKQFPRVAQSGQQNPALQAAGASLVRQDSPRTGERPAEGNAGGRTAELRDWDGSRLMRRNQTLIQKVRLT